MPTYYEVLGVAPDADQARIRDAYVEAVRAAPSVEGGPSARDRQLDEAYAVVGDPDRRRRYDALRATEGSGGNAELLALLAVIADHGSIPTAEDVLGPVTPPAEQEPPAEAPPPPQAPPAEAPPPPQAPPPTDPPVEPSEPAAPATPAAPAAPADEPRPPLPARMPDRRHPMDPQAPEREGPPADRVPGTDGDVEQLGRRRTIAGVVLVALVAGVVVGLLYARSTADGGQLTAGTCVVLTEESATAVPCEDPSAQARISEVVDAPAGCPASPLGALDVEDGVACLTPHDPTS